MRTRQLLTLGPALLLCGGLLAFGGQQQPTFRAGIDVVAIDVSVVDRTGSPIGDLKANDFTVSVDRKSRKILTAQFVRYNVAVAPVVSPAPSPVPEAPVAAPLPPARNVLIVIDEDSMEPDDGLRVKAAAAEFLGRFGPSDRFGVASIPRLRKEITFTRNRDAVRKALAGVITSHEQFRPQPFNIGLAEALGTEPDNRDALSGIVARECCGVPQMPCPRLRYPQCAKDVELAVQQIQTDAHLRGQRSLEALRDLGKAMQQIAGPKTALLISGGVPSPDGRSPARWYSDIEQSFARAQATLYTIYIEHTAYGQTKYQTSPTAAADGSVQREGVEHATSAAGGTWIDAVGTLNQHFDRIAAELSGGYLLGIEVDSGDRDGKPHAVQVKVNRKNVEVRARKQYVIEAASGNGVAAESGRR